MINILCFLLPCILLISCSPEISCYRVSACEKKYKITVTVQGKDYRTFSVVLKNNGLRKLGPIDSVKLIYYKYNINLKQPKYYSVLASSNRFITEVNYDQPITFYTIDYTNSVNIKNGNQFEILVPIDLLIESINRLGSDDNKTQIKSEFQIFWDGYRKGKIMYHLPSSFFKID